MSSALEIARGKMHAARTLWQMMRHLHNWEAVWLSYRSSTAIPPLRFRRGFTMYHGRWDTPVLMLQEIFVEEMYTHGLRTTPDGIVIDIGANIGAVVLDFATRYPGLPIHAYEPNPITFESLERNVVDNHLAGHVRLFHEAVAAKVGTFEIWTKIMSVASSGYLKEAPSANATLASVPCVDLATVLERAGSQKIALLKIDAEGAEVDILNCGPGVSLAAVQSVAVECHDQLRPGALEECRALLAQHGFRYRVRAVAEHAGIRMLYGWRS